MHIASLLRNFTLCHREERSVRRSDLPFSEEIVHAKDGCGKQITLACIFARSTRKMHGNDTILESGCLSLRYVRSNLKQSFFLSEQCHTRCGFTRNDKMQ